jgi:hypothetical protein
MAEWWLAPRPVDRPDPPPPAPHHAPHNAPHRPPFPDTLTTLGMMRHLGHPHFLYWEMRFLQFVKMCLTTDWPVLQGGHDKEALKKWHLVFAWLELDKKSIWDLMTLAHCGLVGRSEANRVLWELLSVWALKDEYFDLSRKTSSLVSEAFLSFERPPFGDPDSARWWHTHILEPRYPQWSPMAVRVHHVTGEFVRTYLDRDGLPQPPPGCWDPPAAWTETF